MSCPDTRGLGFQVFVLVKHWPSRGFPDSIISQYWQGGLCHAGFWRWEHGWDRERAIRGTNRTGGTDSKRAFAGIWMDWALTSTATVSPALAQVQWCWLISLCISWHGVFKMVVFWEKHILERLLGWVSQMVLNITYVHHFFTVKPSLDHPSPQGLNDLSGAMI